MSTINYNCPSCNEVLELEDSYIGGEGECPDCEAPFSIIAEMFEKECPHCAETIKKAAKVCRFCSRDLTDKPKPAPQKRIVRTNAKQRIRADQARRRATAAPAPRVQTVEQTGKGYKALMVIGVLFILLGGIAMGVAASAGQSGNPDSEGAGGIGMALIVLGIMLNIFARVGAWWNHG
ncbi:MAG: hypothetical protein ACI96M_002872 [Candidatus Azotimanducaceae bacterium]|jgi:hypothetical protein